MRALVASDERIPVAEARQLCSAQCCSSAKWAMRHFSRTGTAYFSASANWPCCPWLCPQRSSSFENKLDSYKSREQTPVQRLARARYQLRTHACEPERGQALSLGRTLRTNWQGTIRVTAWEATMSRKPLFLLFVPTLIIVLAIAVSAQAPPAATSDSPMSVELECITEIPAGIL